MVSECMRGRRKLRSGTLLTLITGGNLTVCGFNSGCVAHGAQAQNSVAVSDASPTTAACAPGDCAALPIPEDTASCSNGVRIRRTLCSAGVDAACGWQFPECPAPDAGNTDAGALSTSGLDAGVAGPLTAPLDASPYCGAQECGNAPKSGDSQSCSDGSNVDQSVCEPNTDGLCSWEVLPCQTQSSFDAAGGSACELLPDGGCAVTSGSGMCIPLVANRYDESRGCYDISGPVTLGCFAAGPGGGGFPPRTGCLEAIREGQRFLWFLPTAFVPPGSPPSYLPPFYLYSPGLQACDSRFYADVSSANGCSN